MLWATFELEHCYWPGGNNWDPCLSDHQKPIFGVVLAEDMNMNDIWREALWVTAIHAALLLHAQDHILSTTARILPLRESSYYFTTLIHLRKANYIS